MGIAECERCSKPALESSKKGESLATLAFVDDGQYWSRLVIGIAAGVLIALLAKRQSGVRQFA